MTAEDAVLRTLEKKGWQCMRYDHTQQTFKFYKRTTVKGYHTYLFQNMPSHTHFQHTNPIIPPASKTVLEVLFHALTTKVWSQIWWAMMPGAIWWKNIILCPLRSPDQAQDDLRIFSRVKMTTRVNWPRFWTDSGYHGCHDCAPEDTHERGFQW